MAFLNRRRMNRSDIDKWIAGETEVFFNHGQIFAPGGDSKVGSFSWKITGPAIVIGVGALGVATAVGLFTLTRYSVQPFATADTMPRHTANPSIATDVSVADDPRPNLHQRPTALSDSPVTTVSNDWVDPSPSPLVASAVLPARETAGRPALGEPRSEAKREDRSPRASEALISAPRVNRSKHELLAYGSPRLPMADPLAHPSSSSTVSHVTTPETLLLTNRANGFMNSYWQLISESSDRVLPYLSSTYAPVVSYYGKSLPKQTILRDKYYFLRRWPSRQTWPSPGAETPSIHCNYAAMECVISGLREFEAASAERGARATGVVSYHYALRFSDGSPQIVAEDSRVVAHD